MKNKFKIVYYLIKTVIQIFTFGNLKTQRYKNKKYHHNKNCIILANGPSATLFLKSYQQTKKENDFIICMNDFALSEYYIKLKPSVYFLADPAYFYQYNSKEQEILIGKLYENIITNTNWPMTIRIPWLHFKNKTIHHILNKNTNIRLEFFNSVDTYYPSRINYYLYDWGLCKPLGQNILISVILYAIIQDFKLINLYGADHTWLNNICVNKNQEVCLYNDNFLTKQVSKNEKQYTPWLKAEGGTFSLPEILTILNNVFKGYHELQKYASSKNSIIINNSNNTLIDAFNIPNNENTI